MEVSQQIQDLKNDIKLFRNETSGQLEEFRNEVNEKLSTVAEKFDAVNMRIDGLKARIIELPTKSDYAKLRSEFKQLNYDVADTIDRALKNNYADIAQIRQGLMAAAANPGEPGAEIASS
jgi:uncharacterized coiled-coil DUF342 family protein